MNTNEREVWKLKEHVCVACGADLDEDSFEVYHRTDAGDGVDPDEIDLVCEECHEDLDTTARGNTEGLLAEIEEEMPGATVEQKSLEYLRRSRD
jgi:acetone carboxylase gamma subunit